MSNIEEVKKSRHSWLWQRPKLNWRQCQKCGFELPISHHIKVGICPPKPDEVGLLAGEHILRFWDFSIDQPRHLFLSAGRAIAKAQRDLTASIKDAKYRQAIKDSRDGKALDLTEQEFAIFCGIENMYIEKISTIKDAECQARRERIDLIFKLPHITIENAKYLWQSLKKQV